jgi:hypothetical protein
MKKPSPKQVKNVAGRVKRRFLRLETRPLSFANEPIAVVPYALHENIKLKALGEESAT